MRFVPKSGNAMRGDCQMSRVDHVNENRPVSSRRKDVPLDVLLKACIHNRKLPPVLYRYRAFDQHTASSIADGVQMFSNPFAFNDPFDCQIADTGEYTYKELLTFFTSRGIPRQLAISAADRVQSEGKEGLAKSYALGRQSLMEGTGLLCLSERPDSILMWSHYANCHKGYVLGFTLLNDPAFFLSPFKIRYKSSYPSFSYIRNPADFLEIGMITKSEEWKYEQEVRILKPKKGNEKGTGLRAYKKESLTEVILGCRVNKEDRDKMKRLLSGPDYSHVVLKQASVSNTAFTVNITLIDKDI